MTGAPDPKQSSGDVAGCKRRSHNSSPTQGAGSKHSSTACSFTSDAQTESRWCAGRNTRWAPDRRQRNLSGSACQLPYIDLPRSWSMFGAGAGAAGGGDLWMKASDRVLTL
jgi:hypothetical protein